MKVLQYFVMETGMHGRYGTKLLMKVKYTEFVHQSLIGLHAHSVCIANSVSFSLIYHCAANFSFAQIAKRKSLGRSKTATNSQAQALQHTVWNVSTISKPY